MNRRFREHGLTKALTLQSCMDQHLSGLVGIIATANPVVLSPSFQHMYVTVRRA